jgi:aminoglycoside phosphotransferase (APT) family kinase protein
MAPGESGVWSVLHGDAHVGNVFLDSQLRPSLLDWQCVRRGHWSIDIGYHIASALETSDREKNERDLLVHYLEQLRANGVDAPRWDEAWDEYRKGIVFGLYMWAVTLLVDPEITTTLLQRLGAAAAMHDSFGAVGV